MLDRLDRKILVALQLDGRMSVTDLAAHLDLTVSPTHRRVKDLETSGAIVGYKAVIDAAALGLDFEALVFVTMRQIERETLVAFEEGVARIPQVLQAQRLFGDPDYVLRIRTENLHTYSQLFDDVLSRLVGVQRLSSTLVMKDIVAERPYPAG